ncbi:hypothetical protein [Amycolatopsis kentuckyensis]|uniref:hypothetical protein n=1 Tax=Amycolatopsis kentuckyensis TaxID=218823 RepID=UPI003569D661
MSQYLTPTTAEEDEWDRRALEALRTRSVLSWQQLVAAEVDAFAVHAALDRIVRKLAVDLESRRTSLSALRAEVEAGTVSRARFAEAHRRYAEWRQRVLYFRGHVVARFDELDVRVKDARARQRADANRAAVVRFLDALHEVRRQHVPDTDHGGDPRYCMRCHDCVGDPIEHPCPTHQAVTAALKAVGQ